MRASLTDSDLFPFMETFRGLARVFHLKGDDHDIKSTAGSYFKALRRYPLPLVQAGAEMCLQRNRHFPKPAEWIEAVGHAQKPVEVQIHALTLEQARDYRQAEARKWEGDPCGCSDCRTASVDHRPLRFVPDDAMVRDPIGNRDVRMGHWAHGYELQRWYAARQGFIDFCATRGLKFGHLVIGGLLDVETGGRAALRRRGALTRIITRVDPEPDITDNERANRIRQQATRMTDGDGTHDN